MAIVVGLVIFALQCSLKEGQGWLRVGTIVAVIATAVVVDIMAWVEPTFSTTAEPLLRVAGAMGILSACGLLALTVLARLNRQVDFEPTSSQFVEMDIHCPRCSHKQTIAIGDATCDSCGLRIHTRIEEPRCPGCGYLLYRLASQQCPECGITVGVG